MSYTYNHGLTVLINLIFHMLQTKEQLCL